MAFDSFLKLDGIDGESRVDKYENWIEVLSYSWGVAQTTTSGVGSGAGAGKATFQDLHFVANFSKASPELFKRCATGEHIKTGVLSVRKAGEKPLDFYKVRMTDVLVSSFQDGGGGGDVPIEQISLSFSTVALEFTPQSPTGA
jgi:type VI secretion system secreted protein Hcp